LTLFFLAILRQDQLSLGAILGRDLRTVNKHPKFIFDKLGIETRNAVVAAGIATTLCA
jgi:DNA-binding CsgD family transcriptional regulator